MYQPQDTLRFLRHSLMLRYSLLLWVCSFLLALVCLWVRGALLSSMELPLMALLSGAGMALSHWGGMHLKMRPSWKPDVWIDSLALVHGLYWGWQASAGGLCLTLGIAYAVASCIALIPQWRSQLVACLPVLLVPVLANPGLPTQTLVELHLPLMSLILLASWQASNMAYRNLESLIDKRRLTTQLSRHRDQLESIVSRRTSELEAANKRLNDEVYLRQQVNQTLLKSEEQMNMAMAASGIGFWDWDIAGRRVYHSDQQRFFGQVTDVTDYIDLEAWVDVADRALVRRALRAHLKGRTRFYHARYRLHRPDADRPIWLEDSGRVITRDAQGRPLRMVGTRRDISKDMRLQEELRLSSSLFNNSPDGVFVLDASQRLRTCNRVFSQVIGRQKSQLVGNALFDVIRTEQRNRIAQGMVNNGRWQGDIIALRDGHHRFPMRLTLSAIRGTDGRTSHFLGIVRDLTEQQHTALELDYLHNYDKLTGLFNRAYFHQLLKQFETHEPLMSNQYAVAVLNLDRFKAINESLGQDIGDQLLRDVSARLNNLQDPVRSVARLGGDEFALLFDYGGDRQALDNALSAALEEVSRLSLIDEHELIVTASMGVCLVHRDNLHQLLNQAITAMGQARQRGGNKWLYYRQALSDKPAERRQLVADLSAATTTSQLSVDYQPKLNLSTGLIDSVEALVRWQHPERGPIEPEDFLPLAEEAGLIGRISDAVLQRACLDAARWQRQGLGDIAVSVNLSASQVYRSDLYDRVAMALKQSGLEAKYLELEVTEAMLMEDANHAQDFLNQLRSLGVRLTLDDFGTGFTSLNYLKRFPIQTLKIDRSFIQEWRPGESSPVIEAIMAMADSLKMEVVAEGVESREQLSYLKRLGCGHAQGYLISRPLPATELLTLIQHANLPQLYDHANRIH
ncbi:putative bifunctional diguanylate cyclase/phosphodiesterase [Saccharospirillum mangrovi]|uniref:putative bifunctional diguanylate cyclase/phosphodiesterase n=1 Tax=Saccharospirillum mangrovi TaxID=2161747 RepID=UPI0013B45EB7|nr:EAL domain-containing protein [Saccharospirillum mangrovi]